MCLWGQEEKAAKVAAEEGLKGKDALEELKKLFTLTQMWVLPPGWGLTVCVWVQEEKAAKAAAEEALKGKDAFEELKKLAAAASSTAAPPAPPAPPAERPTIVPNPIKNGGFVKYERQPLGYRPVEERLKDWGEVLASGDNSGLLKTQSARCMDCGTPFCNQVRFSTPAEHVCVLLFCTVVYVFCSHVLFSLALGHCIGNVATAVLVVRSCVLFL